MSLADRGNWVHPPQLHPGVPGQRSAEGEGEWLERQHQTVLAEGPLWRWATGLASLNELCEETADVCPILVFQSCSAARVCRHSPLVCQALSMGSLGLESSWCGNIPHHFREEVSLETLGF